jgi:hypothetical protein
VTEGDGDGRDSVGTSRENRDRRTYIPIVGVQSVRLVTSCRFPQPRSNRDTLPPSRSTRFLVSPTASTTLSLHAQNEVDEITVVMRPRSRLRQCLARPRIKNYGWVKNYVKRIRAGCRASDHVESWNPVLRGAERVLWEVRTDHPVQTRMPHTRLTFVGGGFLRPTRKDVPRRPFSDLSSPLQPHSNNGCLDYDVAPPVSEWRRLVF